MQAPTTGLGVVRPRPRRACSSARFIHRASSTTSPETARRRRDWASSAPDRGARAPAPASSTVRRLPLLLKQRVDVILRRERNQILDAFTDADVFDGQLELVGDG